MSHVLGKRFHEYLSSFNSILNTIINPISQNNGHLRISNSSINQIHKCEQKLLIRAFKSIMYYQEHKPDINLGSFNIPQQQILKNLMGIIHAWPKLAQKMVKQVHVFEQITKYFGVGTENMQGNSVFADHQQKQNKTTPNNQTGKYSQQYIDRLYQDHKNMCDLLKNRSYREIYSLQVCNVESDCLGCIKEVIEDQPLPNTGQVYSLLANLGYEIQQLIKKKAVAILNERGGYLFFTNQEAQKPEIDGSIDLHKQHVFNEMANKFREILNLGIYPDNFKLFFDCLPVVSIKNNQKSQTGKNVMRIILTPEQNTYVYFLKRDVQKQKSYHSLFFQDKLLGQIEDFMKPADLQKIYETIHHEYGVNKRQKSKTNQQTFAFKCIRPVFKQKNSGTRIIINNHDWEQPLQQDKSIDKVKMSLQKIQQLSWQMAFNHNNTSLIILSTQNDKQMIKAIKRNLALRKMNAYSLYKPYPGLRDNSIRSILLITHNHPSPQIQSILKLTTVHSCKFLALITVTCFIIIKDEDPKEQRIQKYFQSFYDIFRKKVFYFATNPQQVYNQFSYDIYIKVDTYMQSVFTFVMLQNLRIKITFTKEKQFKPEYQKYMSAKHS